MRSSLYIVTIKYDKGDGVNLRECSFLSPALNDHQYRLLKAFLGMRKTGGVLV